MISFFSVIPGAAHSYALRCRSGIQTDDAKGQG